jgi:hypothetical protein
MDHRAGEAHPMSLQKYVLTTEEVQALDAIYQHIDDKGDRDRRELSDYIRQEFKLMLQTFGIDKITPYHLSRILIMPSKAKELQRLMLYHYTVQNLRFDLKYKFGLDKYKDLTRLVAALVDHGRKAEKQRRREKNVKSPLLNIENSFEMDDHLEEVPGMFCKQYLGYRRSSTLSGIIRFSIHIEPFIGDRRRVYFSNHYVRNDIRWIVKGSGLYVNRVLYLYGHARSDDTNESLGLRFFALRPLENTEILIGPIITMNFEEPIAARGVLIPLERHKLDLTGDTEPLVEELLTRNAKASIVDEKEEKKDPKNAHRQMRKRVYDDVFGSLREDAFKGTHLRATRKTLLQLLRNGTYTVLKGKPDWSSDNAYRICDEHAVAVDMFQSEFANELDLKEKHTEILKQFMSADEQYRNWRPDY